MQQLRINMLRWNHTSNARAGQRDRERGRGREWDTRGVCATSAAAWHNLVGHRPTIYCFIKYPADDPHLINVNCTCHPLHFGPKMIICLSTSSWKLRLGHFNFSLFCFWPWWPSLFWLMGLFSLLAFTSVYVSLFTSCCWHKNFISYRISCCASCCQSRMHDASCTVCKLNHAKFVIKTIQLRLVKEEDDT